MISQSGPTPGISTHWIQDRHPAAASVLIPEPAEQGARRRDFGLQRKTNPNEAILVKLHNINDLDQE
jgi:hypothetical protein